MVKNFNNLDYSLICMRLWSIHPKYLDVKGLGGLWREALLARKVLLGKTLKYKNHPQMTRFKKQKNPLKFINTYLLYVWKEGRKRGYCFDRKRIGNNFTKKRITVTKTQLHYEQNHLKKKLQIRDQLRYKDLVKIKNPESHPLFRIIKGPIEKWEKIIKIRRKRHALP